MDTGNEHDSHEPRDQPRHFRRFVVPRTLVAALAGIVLGALCPYLPEPVQAPCEMVSRVLPAACNGEPTR